MLKQQKSLIFLHSRIIIEGFFYSHLILRKSDKIYDHHSVKRLRELCLSVKKSMFLVVERNVCSKIFILNTFSEYYGEMRV